MDFRLDWSQKNEADFSSSRIQHLRPALSPWLPRWHLVVSQFDFTAFLHCQVGSGNPGDPKAYEGIILKKEGSWWLNGSSGQYSFDASSGWLTSETGDRLGRFICKQIQDRPLELPVDSYSKLQSHGLKIVSSEIMAEIQKPENAGALFVLPSQLNGAEYPSHTHVVKSLEEYKSDNTGGPRGQLAVHPAAAQFVLDNAASEGPQGINAIDEILNMLPDDLELVNGYLKVHDTQKETETLELLVKYLNTLRPLVMEEIPATGLLPDKKGFAECGHTVGLVYASAVPVDSYLNQGGKVDFQAKVSELILIGQYYGALKYAAESQRHKGSTTRRKVFLMPLGGGVFNNPWDIIATRTMQYHKFSSSFTLFILNNISDWTTYQTQNISKHPTVLAHVHSTSAKAKSMAKAIQLMDDDMLSLLDIFALTYQGNPSEEQKLKIILGKLNSHPAVRSSVQAEQAEKINAWIRWLRLSGSVNHLAASSRKDATLQDWGTTDLFKLELQ